MVIVDTSALMAIVVQEPGYERLVDVLVAPTARSGIGTPTLAELGIVLTARLGHDQRALVTRLLDEFHIEAIPFGEEHWREAVGAFERFGQGRHRAALNFGDCLTYAVARLADEPLLYVGDDFSATDLDAA